jgi:acyl-CoA dehydrogenase
MSDNDMTEEVRQLRRQMRQFIDGEVIPAEPVLGDETDAAGAREAIDRLKALAKAEGLWALGHPKEIGGGGLGFMPFVYLNEIIGRSEWGQIAVGTVSMQDSITLHRYASAEQQERWLKPLVEGDIYPSVGLTEPEVAGSDPTLMQTSAVLDGDEWVINGHKWFTTGAPSGRVHHRLRQDRSRCREVPAVLRDHRADRLPGYDIVRAVPTMGQTGGDHCDVRYRDVRVPKDNLLGPRGQGFLIAQKRLGAGRIFHCMRWLGQGQRAFELMCDGPMAATPTDRFWPRRERSSVTSPSRRPTFKRPG